MAPGTPGGHAVGHAGHAAVGDGALRKLSLEAHAAVLLALREGDVEGLGARHLAVHLGHRAGGLVGGGKGDERRAAAVGQRGEERERASAKWDPKGKKKRPRKDVRANAAIISANVASECARAGAGDAVKRPLLPTLALLGYCSI